MLNGFVLSAFYTDHSIYFALNEIGYTVGSVVTEKGIVMPAKESPVWIFYMLVNALLFSIHIHFNLLASQTGRVNVLFHL